MDISTLEGMGEGGIEVDGKACRLVYVPRRDTHLRAWTPLMDWIKGYGIKPKNVAGMLIDPKKMECLFLVFKLTPSGKRQINRAGTDAMITRRVKKIETLPPEHPLDRRAMLAAKERNLDGAF